MFVWPMCLFTFCLCRPLLSPTSGHHQDNSTALSIAMEANHREIGVLLYAHINFKQGSPVSFGDFLWFRLSKMMFKMILKGRMRKLFISLKRKTYKARYAKQQFGTTKQVPRWCIYMHSIDLYTLSR